MAVKSVGYMMGPCDSYKRSICRFKLRAFERLGKGRGLEFQLHRDLSLFRFSDLFLWLELGTKEKNQVRVIRW